MKATNTLATGLTFDRVCGNKRLPEILIAVIFYSVAATSQNADPGWLLLPIAVS